MDAWMRDRALPPDAATLARLITRRHSCRGYRPDPVPQSDIETMLRIAQGAASWCNSQPWHVIVTSGEATERFRDALYAHASSNISADPAARAEDPDFAFPLRYTGIYKQRQRETGWALYKSVGVSHGDRAASGRQMLENFRLFGAPHVMIISAPDDLGVYGAIDCGAYIAYVMLVAESMGISSIAQAAIAGCAGFVRAHFGIPPDYRIVCGLSFGYEDTDHPANAFRTSRAPLGEVATFVS
jgi:nitroreductase